MNVTEDWIWVAVCTALVAVVSVCIYLELPPAGDEAEDNGEDLL